MSEKNDPKGTRAKAGGPPVGGGAVSRGGHGPQNPVAAALSGSALLRSVLKLSPDVGVETVCHEAALKLQARK